MPSREEHLAQAARNEALAQQLVAMGEAGWAITGLFYAALHLIQAYLVQVGPAPVNHQKRAVSIAATVELARVVDPYRLLKALSENARYDCRAFSPEQFEEVRRTRYQPIVEHLNSLNEEPEDDGQT